jgi:hypothetical protein
MRRRDVLKAALIVAAIPVGAKMVWERTPLCREMQIRRKMHRYLFEHSGWRGSVEAYEHIDDVLDLTFSIVPEGKGPSMHQDLKPYIKAINSYLEQDKNMRLTGEEEIALEGVYVLVKENYEHQVSEDAMGFLLSGSVTSKAFQMRPEMYMEE